MDSITQDCFRCDLGIAKNMIDTGVSADQIQGANISWEKWSGVINKLALDSLLKTVDDKISVLQVFAQRVHTGEHTAQKNTIRT